MSECALLLSGFADEAAIDKTVDQQFAAMAAIGFQFLTLRFIDTGQGVQNAIDLELPALDVIRRKLDDYGLQVSSLGSPIGKVKLLDVEDGTSNEFFAFDRYLDERVRAACRVANRLQTRLVRGFSFYPPRGEDPRPYVPEAADRISKICEVCEDHDLVFGLEVEANLVGHDAETLMSIHDRVGADSLVLIFDGANLATQGYSRTEIIRQFGDMLPALGWIHVKDYRSPTPGPGAGHYVDEDALRHFVPAGEGDSGYPEILQRLKSEWEFLSTRLKTLGLPGLFADLEPHLKGGGQFGGFSGPDGFGVAARAFCRLCDTAGINYRLRDFDSNCSADPS